MIFSFQKTLMQIACHCVVQSKQHNYLWNELSREKLEADAGNFFRQFLKYALYMQNKLCLMIKQQIYNLILQKTANFLHCELSHQKQRCHLITLHISFGISISLVYLSSQLQNNSSFEFVVFISVLQSKVIRICIFTQCFKICNLHKWQLQNKFSCACGI